MATTGGLRERKKSLTRRRLQEAAVALFAERGFDHVTAADIADVCDVSEKTFFAYFPSKLDVALADIDDELDRLAALITHRPPGQAVADMLAAAAHGRIELARRHSASVALRLAVPALAERAGARRGQRESELLRAPLADDLGCDIDDPRVAVALAAFSGISNGLDPLLAAAIEPEPVIDLAVRSLRAVVDELRR